MKYILSTFAIMLTTAAMAQETYESAQLATEDLNGTARYVGMGGAMEALGADITTMHTNPAGVGMMRRSWIGITGGATIQSGTENVNGIFNKTGVTNADLDQVGFVYSTDGSGDNKWSITKEGYYHIRVDVFRETVHAEYLGANPTEAPTAISLTPSFTNEDGEETANGRWPNGIYFDLGGRRLNSPQRGINIVRTAEGKIIKTIVK